MSIKRTNRDFNLSVAKQLIEDGGTLIDVRTWSEFCSGHICGAHIVPTPLPDELERNPKLLKIFADNLGQLQNTNEAIIRSLCIVKKDLELIVLEKYWKVSDSKTLLT